jgi:two-component system, chemotaxis family, chemotaxis protein CheY
MPQRDLGGHKSVTTVQNAPNVLIVDDDAFVRTYLRDMLADTGYCLSEASNGEEAVKLVTSDQPEVVLLDLFMPKQSGLEALTKIRAVSPKSRVIVISSMDSEGVVEQAMTAGARGFVAKPFHPLEVLGAVRRALEA